MMDEQLIDEVAQHGVIFNRQKYYLNGSASGGKYETKDEAWQLIALKLRTDVETCKKRWKYLRERYVSQRKQGDPPVYEHLSRPYLEKMKFLDQHIQPRKSYRNVPNFLTSPHSANSSNYSEYNVDSKSNSSLKNMSHFGSATQNHHYQQQQQHHQSSDQQQHTMNALSSVAASALENVNGQVKIEAEIFRDFAAAVASQQLQHISHSQMQQQQAAAVAAVMADSSQGYQEPYRDSAVGVNAAQHSAGSTGGLTSTSSSMKSPLSSPLPGISLTGVQEEQNGPSGSAAGSATGSSQQPSVHSSSSNMQVQGHGYHHKSNDDLHSSTSSNYHTKKPRVQLNSNGANHGPHANNGSSMVNANGSNNHFGQDSDEDSDDNSTDIMTPQTMLQHDNHYNNSVSMQRNAGNGNMSGNNNSNSNNNNSNNNNSNNQQQLQQQQQQHQNMFPANSDFLFQLYQQLPQQAGTSHASSFGKFQSPPNPPSVHRSSEHLLGELVTTELLKMSKDRRKNVQKRILEILFFDD